MTLNIKRASNGGFRLEGLEGLRHDYPLLLLAFRNEAVRMDPDFYMFWISKPSLGLKFTCPAPPQQFLKVRPLQSLA